MIILFYILIFAVLIAIVAFTMISDHKHHIIEEYRKCLKFERKMGFKDRRMEPDRRHNFRSLQNDRRKYNIKDSL